MDNGYVPEPVYQATIADEDLGGAGGNDLIDDPDTLNLDPGPAAPQTVMAGTQAIQPSQTTVPAPAPQNPPAHAALQAAAAVPLILKGGGSSITKIEETLDNKKNNWTMWSESMMTLFDLNDVVDFIVSWVPCPERACDPVGVKNWRYNNAYAKLCINNNTACYARTLRICKDCDKYLRVSV